MVSISISGDGGEIERSFLTRRHLQCELEAIASSSGADASGSELETDPELAALLDQIEDELAGLAGSERQLAAERLRITRAGVRSPGRLRLLPGELSEGSRTGMPDS